MRQSRALRYRRCSGYVYLVIVLALATVLLSTFERLGRAAERASVEASIRLIERDLMTRALVHLVRGEYRALAELAHRDPVLDASAVRRDRQDTGPLRVGDWRFDETRRELVYRAAYAGPREPEERRFRLIFEYDDGNDDGRFGHPNDRFVSVGLREMD